MIREGGREVREKGEQFLFLNPRERKSCKNEGKMALVALNSPCGFLPFYPSS